MNVTKSKNLMLALAVVMMLNFNSCKKYDDGPAFSLKTANARLTGAQWEVVEIDGDDVDDGELYLEFDNGGDFKVTYEYSDDGFTYTYSYEGEWEWEDNKEVLKIDFDDYDMEWEVKRLTSSEFWFEDEYGDDWECEAK